MSSPLNLSPSGLNQRSWALFLAVLISGLIFSYIRVIDAPFVHDDLPQITYSNRIQQVRTGQAGVLTLLIPRADHRRPLPIFTFALNFRWVGDGPRSFHLANLGIHLVNVLLLLGLSRRMASIVSGSEPPFWPFALGALLWAFLPVHTQAVSFIVQRMTLLCALFLLASLRLWIEAGEQKGWKSSWLYLAAGASAILALLSKESAASLPLLVLIWEWISPRSSRRRLACLALAAAALYLVGGLALAHYSSNEIADYANRYGRLPDRLLSQPRMFWHYLSLLAFPHPVRLNVEPEPMFSTGLFSPRTTAPALAGLVLLWAAATTLMRRRSLTGFGLLFFFVALLPESGFWPIALEADHRLYLPSSLLMVGLTATVGRGHLRGGLIAVCLVFLCLLTFSRNRSWESGRALWRDAVAKEPGFFNNWQNLAAADMGILDPAEKHLGAAMLDLYRTRFLNPYSYKAHLSQAYLFITLNRIELFRALGLGERSCEAARMTTPANADSLLAWSQCEAEAGRRESALELENRVARIVPRQNQLLWFMAWDLAASGQRDRALRLVEDADPHGADYERILQRGQLALLAGDDRGAAKHYRQALELRPEGIEALVGMGQALEKSDPRGAVEFFRRARRVDPTLALATEALCNALAETSDPEADAVCRLADLQDPFLALGWKNLGRELIRRQEFARALGCLTRAARLMPDDREIPKLLEAARVGTTRTAP